jgi:putative FmdB family regulatory protein
MPLYNSKCNKCGHYYEFMSKVNERDKTPPCCGELTERVLLQAPVGYVDNPAFMSQYKKLY